MSSGTARSTPAPMQRARLLVVGAFPASGRAVYGGMVTSCRALLRSSLPGRADLTLVDTTQSTHPPPRALVRGWLALRRMVGYIAALERSRPDAVMLFVAAGMSVADKGAMAWYARLRGVPALLFPRGGPVLEACRRSRLARTWVRLAFHGARMILCQGPAWHRFALETLGFAPEAAPVIPNWTASDELLELGRARQDAAAAPRVLFVGWLDREKGITELLHACRELAAQRQFTLHLAGEGNLSAEARAFVAAHGLGERVQFCGWLGEPGLREQYARADIFVLPSWSEGLPNAMIEAMAAGLAVVATEVGNIPDTLQNETSALLVPPRDAAALRAALQRLIDDAALRRELGLAAHRIAATQFGVEPAVERIINAVARARTLCPRGRAQHRAQAG
jgi:glycosyltransferase involved in cell wall biosynthesis